MIIFVSMWHLNCSDVNEYPEIYNYKCFLILIHVFQGYGWNNKSLPSLNQYKLHSIASIPFSQLGCETFNDCKIYVTMLKYGYLCQMSAHSWQGYVFNAQLFRHWP